MFYFLFLTLLTTILCADTPFEDSPYIFPEYGTGKIECDFLWYKPYAPIPSAIRYQIRNLGSTTIYKEEKIHQVNFSFHPGFRIGLTFATPKKHWNLHLLYSRIVAKDTTFAADNEYCLQGIWGTARTIELEDRNNSSFTQQYTNANTLDGNLSYSIYQNHFVFRPFIGIRASSIKNHLYPTYKGVSKLLTQAIEDQIRLTNTFRGAGVQAGFYSDYVIYKLWKLFTKASCSLLVSRNTFQQTERFSVENEESIESWTKKLYNSGIQTCFALALGTSAAYQIPCYNQYLALSCAFESYVWPDLLYFPSVNPTNFGFIRNSYGAQGFTFRATFGF